MKPDILPYAADAEFFFEEGCHIIELSNRTDDPAVSIARVRLGPGMTTRLHRLHGVVERYVILQGEARVDLGEIRGRAVAYGDVVTIPALCPQRITNTGAAELIFLAICSPRFNRACYEDLE